MSDLVHNPIRYDHTGRHDNSPGLIMSFKPFLISALIWLCATAPAHTLASDQFVTSLLEIRHKNVVIQNWDLSCGAAALSTLLKFQHGIKTTEKEVATSLISRKEYIDNPDLLAYKQGFSLLDMKLHVEKLGLSGDGFGQLEFTNLIKLAPVIVPVRIQDYNHFVVFRGTAGNRVLLADPAWGNRTMTRSSFEKAWIDFGNLGKIGFVVNSESYNPALNKLRADAMDFVMVN